MSSSNLDLSCSLLTVQKNFLKQKTTFFLSLYRSTHTLVRSTWYSMHLNISAYVVHKDIFCWICLLKKLSSRMDVANRLSSRVDVADRRPSRNFQLIQPIQRPCKKCPRHLIEGLGDKKLNFKLLHTPLLVAFLYPHTYRNSDLISRTLSMQCYTRTGSARPIYGSILLQRVSKESTQVYIHFLKQHISQKTCVQVLFTTFIFQVSL